MNHQDPLSEVNPQMLKDWQKHHTVFIVDLRETPEYRRERLEGSASMPLSLFDPSLLPKERKIVFYGTSDDRSFETLKQHLLQSHLDAYYLKGGLKKWKEAGFLTVGEKEAMQDIPRKAKILLGALIGFGCIFGFLYTSVLLLIPLAIGAALFYDGWANEQWIAKTYNRLFTSGKSS